MFYRILIFIFLSYSFDINAQSIQEITCDHELEDCKYVQVDDSHYYLIQSSIPSDGSSNEPVQLSISYYDDCGLLYTHSYTHEYVEQVKNIKESWLDGDTLRIALFVSPGVVHGRREMGLFSYNRVDHNTTYKYFREDGGGVYYLSMVPTEDGKFAFWCFFTNVYKPSVYGAFILDQNFNIEHQYVNFQEGVITGSLAKVPGGYIANSGSTLIHFDTELTPKWTKKMPTRNFLQKKIVVDDGIVMLRSYNPYQEPKQINVLKINFSGEVMWESENILTAEEGFSRSNLIQRPDGKFSALTFRWEAYRNQYTDTLYQYIIDDMDGSILSAKTTKGNTVIPKFRFLDFTSKNNDDLLVLEEEESRHILWPLSDDLDCMLSDTLIETQDLPELILEDVPFAPSLEDYFETGSYVWNSIDIPFESRIFCEREIQYQDLFPQDTIGCVEEDFILDVRSINQEIIWEDGSTEKVRKISEDGIYEYQIDHCSTEYSEAVSVVFESCTCELILPNVVSLSSQNENSYFSLNGQCPDLISFRLHIVDKWGSLIYETEDRDFIWDGTIRGAVVESGVYLYQITYKSKYTTAEVLKIGDVTVLRS